MPVIEAAPLGAHARTNRQRKRKEPDVVDERTARLQKRMVGHIAVEPCPLNILLLPCPDIIDCRVSQSKGFDARRVVPVSPLNLIPCKSRTALS